VVEDGGLRLVNPIVAATLVETIAINTNHCLLARDDNDWGSVTIVRERKAGVYTSIELGDQMKLKNHLVGGVVGGLRGQPLFVTADQRTFLLYSRENEWRFIL
jgi:hypothetical protein